MTRIAVLETGYPPSRLREAYGTYVDMFRALLNPGFEIERYDVQAAPPPSPDGFDGVVITGSAAGVYEGDRWIGTLLDWIADARGRTRLVGVCFGHQAMAQALGGHVEKSDRGWGVGLHTYRVTSREAWMTPPVETLSIPVSHQDQVIRRPHAARVFLTSDFTPFAGLAWGDDAISMQCHPEFTPAFAGALIAGRSDRVPEDRIAAALDSLRKPGDREVAGLWMNRFLSGG